MKRLIPIFILLFMVMACNLARPTSAPPSIATATEEPSPRPTYPQNLLAYYPLISDLDDATGRNSSLISTNTPFLPGGGIYCNGYTYSTGGCSLQTPPLNGFNFTSFTISTQFLVPGLWGVFNPVFVGGNYYRWVTYYLAPDGSIELVYNSNQEVDCTVKYQFNTWHEATITYNGQTLNLYLDGVLGCSATATLEHNDENSIQLSNTGSGSTFWGFFRELKVYDSVVLPPVVTATQLSPSEITIPPGIPPASGSVDELLAQCPSAAELAAIDADLQITFETDPIEALLPGPLACTASEGSRDLTTFQKRVYNAIRVMKQVQFDQPLSWTTQSLYDWFVSNVNGIRLRGDIEYSSCCDPTGVINISVPGLGIVYTDRWATPASPVGVNGFVVLLVHEARHADGYPHTCGTDDKTLAEMGAWAVQYYLDQWFAYHADPTFLSAADADYPAYSLEDADGVRRLNFCNEPAPTP